MSVLLATLALALSPGNPPDGSLAPVRPAQVSIQNKSPEEKATPLAFSEFLFSEKGELKISPKLQSLNGKRVRLVGYMASLEEPIKGGFFLCPLPVINDESGGGTGDLPVHAVRVLVASAKDRTFEALKRPISVVGILEVGNQSAEDGIVSLVRLRLDPPAPVKKKPVGKSTTAKSARPSVSSSKPSAKGSKH